VTLEDIKPQRRPAHLPCVPQQPSLAYNRRDCLPALLGLWPNEVEDYSVQGTSGIIKRLERALRAERYRRGSASWSYDINRHIRIVRALKEERGFLAALVKGGNHGLTPEYVRLAPAGVGHPRRSDRRMPKQG
jgi:hypothetical protein